MKGGARTAAMGTATGPAGQLAIGGSKGGTGAKGEAAFLPGACRTRAAPPPRRFRPGRSEGAWGRGPGMAYLPENVGLHEDTDTPEFLAALF